MKIVDEVCDASKLMSITFTLARAIASYAPFAVHGIRASIQSPESNFRLANYPEYLERRRETAFKSKELAESPAAFKGKKIACFQK